jgi:hypothetical protein
MFSEVRHAILPLALRRLKRRGDLERAALLIESLGRHWCDPKPFELLIVAPSRDAELLRANLPRIANINVTLRPESDFFEPLSGFYLLTGWYRQQIIKLHVPAVLNLGGYLTFDSDVVCVGDFDSRTFLAGNRAISRWEPKDHQPWWQQVASIVGVPYEPSGHGLSVTPNLLHSDLARQALAHFANGRGDACTNLGLEILRRIGVIRWTEYSLYTSVAELKGNLLDYHLHWDACYSAETHLFSERSCVWGADDFERMAGLPNGTDPGGKFIIVQSFARIPVDRVREYCLSFAD